MDIEALLSRHWEALLDLRAEHLAYILNTEPADRDKLEFAIANTYRLAELEPPRQIIWFDSQIEARLAIAMWSWMLDPFVHGIGRASNIGSESNFLLRAHEFLVSADQKLQEEFPTLYSNNEKPELLLSSQFEEVFQARLHPESLYRDLTMALAVGVKVVGTDPLRIAVTDGWANANRLLDYIKDPQAATDAFTRQGLEENLNKSEGGQPQELFGAALSVNLIGNLRFPINGELSEIIENALVQRLIAPYDKVKDVLLVNRADWDRIGTRISAISAPDNKEFRSSLVQRARGLAALTDARSPIANSFPAAMHRALRLLGVEDLQTVEPLMDAVKAGGWWWPFKDICFACDNPSELHVDSKLRLHNENGMAVRFRDGWGFWALNDVVVSEKIVQMQYSAADIDAVSLDEFLTREIMIRRFGLGRYLKESRAVAIHKDEYGVLYRKTDPAGQSVGILVTDHTSDSEFNQYSILVPPNIVSANEAVAWIASQRQF